MTHRTSIYLPRLALLSLVLACLGLASTVTASAARSPVRANAIDQRADAFEVGTLRVEKHGTHGTPLIFIPGLASGAWAWEGLVRRFQDSHVLYVVTLAGFDGRPAVAGKPMQLALQSLKDLLVVQHIVKPVLIGHSLGGVLALQLAEQDPGSISGLVSIDGLPVFPGTEAMPPSQRPLMADGIKARMAGMTGEQFAGQQLQYMRGIGVIDPALAAKLAGHSANSDPAATTEYMAETLALDLRADLAKITVPVLLIAPYNAADSAAQNISESAKTDYYRSLLAGTPTLDVVPVSPSRHFAMFDQPTLVADAIDSYLAKLAAVR